MKLFPPVDEAHVLTERSIAHNRKYRWLRPYKVKVHDGRDPSKLYLTSWTLFGTPWFIVTIHKIENPDWNRTLHDHGSPFISFILRGGYTEERMDNAHSPIRMHRIRPGRLNWFSNRTFHRVHEIHGEYSLNFVVMLQPKQEWGYLVPGVGWVPVLEYYEKYYNML